MDNDGNLTLNGQPFLLIEASAHSYNDWRLGGYTEAQADAMLQIAVNGGLNCLLSPIDNLFPYTNPQYAGLTNAAVISSKFPQILWNADDRHAVQTQAGVRAFVNQYGTLPILLWCFASEPGNYANRTNYGYIRTADSLRQVIGTQVTRGPWHSYSRMYGATVFDGGNQIEYTNAGNTKNGFVQTDADANCGAAPFCSGRTASQVGFLAQFKGTFGSLVHSVSVNPNAANEIVLMWELPIPAQQTEWLAGNWAVRVNVTTANANVTLTEVYLCQVAADPDCTSKGTIGSLTGQNVSCATTGVKTFTVSGAASAHAAGDRVFVLIAASNSAVTSQTVGVSSDQYIDSPFLMDLLWDELASENYLTIPFLEYLQDTGPVKLWEYLLLFNRRLHGLSTPYPTSPPTAVDGGAGSMTGTFQFLYTWVSGQREQFLDSVESFASPPSNAIALTSGQAALSGIAIGPAGVTGRNVYATKAGVSPSGQYSTSGYNLVAVITDNTTTAITVNEDYPFYNAISAGAGNPPPKKTRLDWMPAISTTYVYNAGMDYSGPSDHIIAPLTLDSCRRWYFLQVAFNCRVFDVLAVWNQRGVNGDNDPVVGAMSGNAQIALTSVAGDTGTCEIEGILTDGVTVYREAIALTGTTPALSGQTYSMLKWAGAQTNTVGPVAIQQGAGGPNLIVRNPVAPHGNPALTLPRGHGIFKAGADGLPYGVLQLYNDTWTALSHVNSLSAVILAPGLWTQIVATVPVFSPPNEASSGVNASGLFAVKKTVGAVLYVIAINVDEVQGVVQLAPLTTGDLISGSAIITNIPSTSTWAQGMPISGPGIPYGATIASVDSSTQIHLSATTTRTAAGSYFQVALENTLLGKTIDCGQTINSITRIAGESGSPSFAGSVITDDFLPMAVHVYRIT